MNKILRSKIFGHDWYLRVGRRVTVEGVNSTLSGGESVLFWEFDDKSYAHVAAALDLVKRRYHLPEITILKASVDTSWHAVCWTRLPWLKALSIVADTDGVDPDYIRLAAHREHFTLRMTDKGRGAPKREGVLPSRWLPTASPLDLQTAVSYGAWRKE